jgi:hypothetical protein
VLVAEEMVEVVLLVVLEPQILEAEEEVLWVQVGVVALAVLVL